MTPARLPIARASAEPSESLANCALSQLSAFLVSFLALAFLALASRSRRAA